MSLHFQRFTAVAIVLAIAFAPSTTAENRNRERTSDLERLAADLERAFGRGSVEISREPGVSSRPEPRAQRGSGMPIGAAAPASIDAIVHAMNRERAAKGLRPLRLNGALSAAAADRVDDMLTKRYFDHVSPDGVQPFVWAKRRGYRYRTIGENLAVGFGGTSVVTGWMSSPGHRANILGAAFDEVGIAVASTAPLRGYRGPTVVALYAAAK